MRVLTLPAAASENSIGIATSTDIVNSVSFVIAHFLAKGHAH
jgi:hypothetical protein